MTRLRLTCLSLALGSVTFAATARAQGPGGILPTPEEPPTQQGTRGSAFLHIPVGARANAMAGAVGSSTGGPMAWFWNPAGAASTEGFSIAAGLQKLYGDLDISQTYAAVAMPLLGGAIGLSLNTLGSGDIQRTTEAFPFGDPEATGTFNWSSTAASLGYGRRLTDRLSIGAGVKYITEGITDANTSWVGFDLGTQFNTGIYGLVLGGALQHIGGRSAMEGALIGRVVNTPEFGPEITRTELETRKRDLPTTFRFSIGNSLLGSAESIFGGAGRGHTLMAEAAVSDAVDQAVQLGIGVEYSFRQLLYLRGGKRLYNDDRDPDGEFTYGLSGGFGLRIPVAGRRLGFDYSYTGLGDLQDIQVFSFEVTR
jgi:hypothetical protein